MPCWVTERKWGHNTLVTRNWGKFSFRFFSAYKGSTLGVTFNGTFLNLQLLLVSKTLGLRKKCMLAVYVAKKINIFGPIFGVWSKYQHAVNVTWKWCKHASQMTRISLNKTWTIIARSMVNSWATKIRKWRVSRNSYSIFFAYEPSMNRPYDASRKKGNWEKNPIK